MLPTLISADHDHDFKFGIQLNQADLDALLGYRGGRLYLDYAGEPYLSAF